LLILAYVLALPGRPSHDLNGASASTGAVLGENDALPSGAVATTFPVEQRAPSLAAVTEGAAVCFLHNCLERKVILQMFICYLVHVSETVVASVLVFHANLTYVSAKRGSSEPDKGGIQLDVVYLKELLNFT
jgi:hypothetical protein